MAQFVELYDEGAGVSGQKRIDQREVLDRLYRDIHKGIIGQVVMAREDRLFRNKHMDQVGAFTKLAEEKRIKVIVPPISSAAVDERTRIYDFTAYRDLISRIQSPIITSLSWIKNSLLKDMLL